MLYKFNKFFYHRDMKKKIGFIGLGVMGASMSAHLQNNGLELFVYNRTKSKADNLIKNGATWCDTPKEVAEKSDILFSIVGFPNDVEEVYLGANGVIEGLHEGLICCD
ncbi:NAD(P)-binding domain-containing protein, partial [Bullifex sp.]|uniref:NAD(P)-dependent oxidoreductase n=1 Tax=Bullifex sp. TaxID=2815808 RepID=UPI002A7F6199